MNLFRYVNIKWLTPLPSPSNLSSLSHLLILFELSARHATLRALEHTNE